MDEIQQALLRLGVAALGGFAVGIEREWSAGRDGDRSRFGGVRTFLLLALGGGLAAIASARIGAWAGALLVGGLLVALAVAYFVSAWQGTIDATSEVAGIVVVGAGMLAGAGELALASALFATTALVLVEKSRLHGWVGRLADEEIRAGAQFAALAAVVLPLLPTGPIGPGIEPRKLWAMVLLFAGLSFAGYAALRVVGPGRGHGVAGLLGGLLSSTAVTLQFARQSREAEAAESRALGFGALAASTMLFARVGFLTAVLDRELARTVAPALAIGLLVGGATVVARALLRPKVGESPPVSLQRNPLRLGTAIQMVVLFQLILWLLDWVRARFGEGGIVGSAILLGMTDVDALTFSATELAGKSTTVEVAARALLAGCLSNTLFKTTLAAVVGRGAFRRVTTVGLGLLVAAIGAGIALLAASD